MLAKMPREENRIPYRDRIECDKFWFHMRVLHCFCYIFCASSQQHSIFKNTQHNILASVVVVVVVNNRVIHLCTLLRLDICKWGYTSVYFLYSHWPVNCRTHIITFLTLKCMRARALNALNCIYRQYLGCNKIANYVGKLLLNFRIQY